MNCSSLDSPEEGTATYLADASLLKLVLKFRKFSALYDMCSLNSSRLRYIGQPYCTIVISTRLCVKTSAYQGLRAKQYLKTHIRLPRWRNGIVLWRVVGCRIPKILVHYRTTMKYRIGVDVGGECLL